MPLPPLPPHLSLPPDHPQAYYILDELFIGGQLQESSKNEVLRVSVDAPPYSSYTLSILTQLIPPPVPKPDILPSPFPHTPGLLTDGRIDGGTEGR